MTSVGITICTQLRQYTICLDQHNKVINNVADLLAKLLSVYMYELQMYQIYPNRSPGVYFL